jgi:exo-beta-1,3-glucanase (GH17 family)
MRAISILLLLLLPQAVGWAEILPCTDRPEAAAALAALRTAMVHGRFVAYQPISLQVINGHPTQASRAGMLADLEVLRPKFDGLITYTAAHGVAAIPELADSQHFRALIIGVWNPMDEGEVAAAIAAARKYPKLVVGLALGNELVFRRAATFAQLLAVLRSVHRRAPEIPLSTTEPFHMYYDTQAFDLIQQMDFILPNVHPVFQPWFRSASADQAAQFVLNVVTKLSESYCGPVLVKETGVPTAPEAEGFTTQRQQEFYRALERVFPASSSSAFAYFSAFDAPWRKADSGGQAAEAHWGLFDGHRRAKPVVAQMPGRNAARSH